ncbi:MAG: acetyl-CoA carboxylase biotin carboxyl carrier protein subunit [Candidatus Azobacteroides sp.]|nr:acetyl-CoA carboxylase biotin carboxyl carrier protein subunit [Candidatus Azobacteroides sp.]
MDENKNIEDYNLVEFVVTARKYKTTLTKKYQQRQKWEKPVIGQIKSFLPGTVMSLCVEKGQKVKEGELILEQEAMKMLNQITAPISGIVTEIYVEVGQKVPKNFLMIEIK